MFWVILRENYISGTGETKVVEMRQVPGSGTVGTLHRNAIELALDLMQGVCSSQSATLRDRAKKALEKTGSFAFKGVYLDDNDDEMKGTLVISVVGEMGF
jgi:hypothetical protein